MTIEQDAVQFLRSVYNVMYVDEETGAVDPDKEHDADTMAAIQELMHQVVPVPSALLANAKPITIRALNTQTHRAADDKYDAAFELLKEIADFVCVGRKELILDSVAVAENEAIIDAIPEQLALAITQAAGETANGFLLIIF